MIEENLNTPSPSLRSKVVVWAVETGALKHSFMTLGRDNLCPHVNEINFDPTTNTLLIGGYGLKLWDLCSGKLIREISEKGDARVKWDREHSKLIVFNTYIGQHDPSSGTLTVFDYSPEAVERAKPESKQESKKE